MTALSRARLAAFAFPALPLAAMTVPVYIFLPSFYAQHAGIGLAVIGLALMLSRLADVLIDPLIGVLSDRTKGRFGRRRPWVVAGVPVLMVSVWFLLVPPEGAGASHLFWWSVILYFGWTAVSLPIQAWGAELSADYHERTRIMSWREWFALAGTLVALGIAAAMTAKGEGAALSSIALAIVILMPVSAALLVIFVPDPPRNVTAVSAPLKDRVAALAANVPFRRLVSAYFLNGLANGFPATLFLLFVEHGLGDKAIAGPMLFAYFFSGIVAVPGWLWLSRRFGKHRTWCFAMLWACAFFMLVPFIAPGDAPLFWAVCILTGFSLGADIALPAAMQADAVDADRAGGAPRTGLYFALWGMATKLALALAAGIALPLLEWGGFDAADGGGRDALVVLYAIFPVALKLFAIALMWNFPLTEDVLKRVQKKTVP